MRSMSKGVHSAPQRPHAQVAGSQPHTVCKLLQVEHGRIAVLWLYRQLTEEDKDDLLHE